MKSVARTQKGRASGATAILRTYRIYSNPRPPPSKKRVPSEPNGPLCESVKSFKTCVLNLPVDGSEDHFIYCFKEEQPCETGARQLQYQLSVLQECVRPDPFKDIADSDVEDADDELFILESDDNDIKIMRKFHC